MISTYSTNSDLMAKLESVQQPEGILQTLQFIITTKSYKSKPVKYKTKSTPTRVLL